MNVHYTSQLCPEFIVDAKGRKKAVVIPFAAERREERTVSHEQLLKELKDDGILPA